jgi:hypothetical protein
LTGRLTRVQIGEQLDRERVVGLSLLHQIGIRLEGFRLEA